MNTWTVKIRPRPKLLAGAIVSVVAALAAGGCNALYFYETEKFSLTLEGKPDATEPVSGNLGIKQRVVVVTPARKTKATEGGDFGNVATQPSVAELNAQAARADGLSIISYFDLQKTKLNKLFVADPVNIRTAFITGEAAAQLNEKETAEAAQALTKFETAKKTFADQTATFRRIQTLYRDTPDAKKDQIIQEAERPSRSLIPPKWSAQAPANAADRDKAFLSQLSQYVNRNKPSHAADLESFEEWIKSQ